MNVNVDDQGSPATGRCPICKRPTRAASTAGDKSPYPFCSDRCRLVDLNRWLEGAYQVPSDDDDLDEATPDVSDI